jgi:hypothetical protein
MIHLKKKSSIRAIFRVEVARTTVEGLAANISSGTLVASKVAMALGDVD